MTDKVKKKLKKLIWSIICFIAACVAVNWILKSYTKDLEEQMQSITAAADVTEAQTSTTKETGLKEEKQGTFSNGFAYLMESEPKIAVISFDYTNTSGEISSFSNHYEIMAFQNGIQLGVPIIVTYNENEYQSRENSGKNIKDGITITIEKAYIIENAEDEIEIEIYYTPNIYMNNKTLTDNFKVKIKENPYISEE